MADTKISDLAAASALTGAELVEVVQGGANVRSTAAAIAALAGGGSTIDPLRITFSAGVFSGQSNGFTLAGGASSQPTSGSATVATVADTTTVMRYVNAAIPATVDAQYALNPGMPVAVTRGSTDLFSGWLLQFDIHLPDASYAGANLGVGLASTGYWMDFLRNNIGADGYGVALAYVPGRGSDWKILYNKPSPYGPAIQINTSVPFSPGGWQITLVVLPEETVMRWSIKKVNGTDGGSGTLAMANVPAQPESRLMAGIYTSTAVARNFGIRSIVQHMIRKV